MTFPGWRWNFELLTLTVTSEMRSTLPLFTFDLWIRSAPRGERVKSRAPGSIIGCFNFLRGQIPRATAVNSTWWNGYITLSRAIVSELLW
jgi:hypothetical protein